MSVADRLLADIHHLAVTPRTFVCWYCHKVNHFSEDNQTWMQPKPMCDACLPPTTATCPMCHEDKPIESVNPFKGCDDCRS